MRRGGHVGEVEEGAAGGTEGWTEGDGGTQRSRDRHTDRGTWGHTEGSREGHTDRESGTDAWREEHGSTQKRGWTEGHRDAQREVGTDTGTEGRRVA